MDSKQQRIDELQKEIDELKRKKDLIENSKFPKRIILYPTCSSDELYEKGEELGLTGDALDLFAHAEEWEIVIRIDADGTATLMMEEIKPD
jgi:hypothetical protein